MANPYLPSPAPGVTPPILTERNFMKKYEEIDSAIRNKKLDDLLKLVKEDPGPVNLSQDPLLSVVIAYERSDIAIRLIKEMSEESMMAPNYDGDTALHVAAAKGDVRVASALAEKNPGLLEARNKHMEIPLHKAALFGEEEVFWILVEKNSPVDARREDGATMLHCAVMGNAPELALQIAEEYPEQMTSRNSQAVTPLQLVVTIPEAFRSQLRLGSVESLIYAFIPLEERCRKSVQGDEEELEKPSTNDCLINSYKDEGLSFLLKQRKRFPPNYSTLFDILQLGCIPVRWVRVLTFNIIKQLSPGIRHLQYQKQKHKHTMELINYLAKDPGYWDFIDKGRVPEGGSTVPRLHDELPPPMTPNLSFTHGDGAAISTISNSKSSKTTRWDDSPLTLAAKMGLHEFVERILTVCPQSAAYLDAEGMNVLQVAIKHGHEKIVDIIASMTSGNNPILPTWLLSAIEKKTKNTILHFAAAKEVDADQAFALQMQFELQWFERVKKLVPKDLEYSRNQNEKTAQELFTETHKEMVKSGKEQLTEVGKTCSSLVAAVVFASSFSIPGDKDSQNNPIFVHKIAFKVCHLLA
ncbi:Ankyrin repeat-containing protein [Rhynchospora pubera]|uniref:Ankyrin repeat-containing protein n=1 Tax=Rhynchospora pubera TaxID=906938 RepID=A0AAV8BW38_9POAL|nr:Ankyrin repeat-containing protein [Rhynchospora pubera]